MPGLLSIDILISVVSVLSLWLSFKYHLLFSLIPVLLVVSFSLPLITGKTFLSIYLVAFAVGYPVIRIGIATFYLADLLCVLLCFMVIRHKNYAKMMSIPLARYFMMMLAVIGISFVINIHNYSARFLVSGVLFIIIFFKFFIAYFLGFVLTTKENEDRIVVSFYIGVWLTVLVAISQVTFNATSLYLSVGATGLIGGHHSGLGNFLVIPVAISISRLLSNPKNKVIEVATLVLSTSGIFIAQSRSSLAALAVTIPILAIRYFFVSKIQRIRLLVILALVAITGILLGSRVIYNTFHKQGTIDLSSYGRIFMWKTAINSFDSFPFYRKIFGCGVAAYTENNKMLYSFLNLKHSPGAHNQYLHVLVEIGIVGLICYLIWLFKLYLLAYRNMQYSSQYLASWLILVAFIVAGVAQEGIWMVEWHGYTIPAFFFFFGMQVKLFVTSKQIEDKKVII